MTFYITPYTYHRPRRWMRTAFAESDREFALAVNIREEKDEFVLNAFVPGLKAEDLNIQILDDTVSLEGEFKTGDGDYLVSELPNGAFHRNLRLTAPVDADKAEAKITDGLLTLRLPKADSARPKSIKITSK